LWLINSGRAQDAKTREQSDFATIDIDGKTFFYLKKDLPQNKTK
jgi:hypothetical protein